jgi:DNA-binding transcriptional regulator YhcF (GntR family)
LTGSINLTQSLVQKLGSSIVRGDLPAGKSLPIEAELGKKFGASRTVLREAVKVLSTKGLIGQRPRVGTYVHPDACASAGHPQRQATRLTTSIPFPTISMPERRTPANLVGGVLACPLSCQRGQRRFMNDGVGSCGSPPG